MTETSFTKTRVEVLIPADGRRWATHVVVPKEMLDDEPTLFAYSLKVARRRFKEEQTR